MYLEGLFARGADFGVYLDGLFTKGADLAAYLEPAFDELFWSLSREDRD